MKISAVKVRQENFLLKEPYPLSFTTVTSFQTCIITIETDAGSSGMGEATALPGYSSESHEAIYSVISKSAEVLPGLDLEQARRWLDNLFRDAPFAVSAIGTALDLAFNQVSFPEQLSIPLIAPLSPYEKAEVTWRHLERAIKNGYKTVKVKIGRDVEQDIDCLPVLSRAPSETVFRFDANQGYGFDEAVRFIKKIEGENMLRVEALEQPFPPGSWAQMEKIRQMTAIPLMLDESIFNESDIIRAADIGMDFIKLKLCKTKGISNLIAKATLAHKKGLQVVLGNGVATDLTNLAEAIVFASYSDVFKGAFEGNGFVKMRDTLLDNSLQVKAGKLVWERKQSLSGAPGSEKEHV